MAYWTNRHPDPLIQEAIEETWRAHPYYATAIDRLRIIADDSVPTMATSADWVTHYNRKTLREWTVKERATVLVHELEHLLRDHHGRCGDRDPGQWNRAGDAEINQRLTNLPKGAILPETFGMPRGRVAEVYYGAMQQQQPDPQQGEGQGEGQGQGEGSGSGSGAEGEGQGEGAPGHGQPAQCGSAAGGPRQPHEARDAQQPGRGAQQGEAEAARKEAAQQILAGNAPGTEAGSELRDWAEVQLGIDRSRWYAALAGAVGHVMAPHGAPVRWNWPGRRDPRDMGGAMVPRWTGNRPSCAVVIDTSSSVTPFDLEMAVAAGHYIARVADVTFYTCDTQAQSLGSRLPDRLRGGGGTDLRVGIAMAIAEGAKAVVVITDCYTPWPSEPTSVPVIIGANPQAEPVLAQPPGVGYSPPDWMTVLPVVADGVGR